MKKKIGFIDYYIDEGHANSYPTLIRDSSYGDRYEVSLAWQAISPPDKKSLKQWCEEQGGGAAESMEQVVAECDCLVVLSPDHPEEHEALADLSLGSGKPVYVDKPFATSLAAARRLSDRAKAHNTPLMSCSALRFSDTLQAILADEVGKNDVHFVSTRGGGLFHEYAIHQLEILVMALGVGARRVMQAGNADSDVMLIDYADGRRGVINLMQAHPFQISIRHGQGQISLLPKIEGFFPRFVEGMLTFFETRESLVPEAELFEIAALLEVGHRALSVPDQWFDVPIGS